LHIGHGRWLLVDSCLDSTSGEPASLQYLEALGVEANGIVLIVASHWHDDHVGGLSRLVASYADAPFYFSAVLRDEEFRLLVEAGARSLITRSGTSELASVLDTFARRALSSGARPQLAYPNSVLWEDERAQVRSLSPSNEAVIDMLERISALVPQPRAAKRRIIDPRPNSTSVVLWVQAGDAVILLGGDLERRGDPALAWKAILGSHVRPSEPAQVFKVPHHGSQSAYEPRVWEEMLIPEPIAVLTPFNRSHLPTDADVTRICGRTPHAFITAPPRPGRTRTRSSTVTKTVQPAVRYLRNAEQDTGHVRLRTPLDGGGIWSVELFQPAVGLCA
jgi:hypothetical protein